MDITLKKMILDYLKYFSTFILSVLIFTIVFLLFNDFKSSSGTLSKSLTFMSWHSILINNYVIFLVIIISGIINSLLSKTVYGIIIFKFIFLYLISISMYSLSQILLTLLKFGVFEISGYAIGMSLGNNFILKSKDWWIFFIAGSTFLIMASIIEQGVL